MARVDIKLPDDFLEKLQHLGSDEEGIAKRVLEAGAEVVEGKVRSNLAAVIGSGTKTPSRSTGQLLAALGVSGLDLHFQLAACDQCPGLSAGPEHLKARL